MAQRLFCDEGSLPQQESTRIRVSVSRDGDSSFRFIKGNEQFSLFLFACMYKFLSSVLTLSINFQRMLEFKPNDRISASESLWHSWFVDRD